MSYGLHSAINLFCENITSDRKYYIIFDNVYGKSPTLIIWAADAHQKFLAYKDDLNLEILFLWSVVSSMLDDKIELISIIGETSTSPCNSHIQVISCLMTMSSIACYLSSWTTWRLQIWSQTRMPRETASLSAASSTKYVHQYKYRMQKTESLYRVLE